MTTENKKDDSAIKSFSGRRIALVHDWLTGMRGGEMVLEELCYLFPDADLYTIVHRKGSVSEQIENRRIFESPIARMPMGREHYRKYLPLFPWAIESFDFRGYELIISTSSSVAKGIIPPPDALHVSYLHTPMRYIWDMRSDYLNAEHVSRLGRFVGGWCAHYLRNWDVSSSARVDQFIANSNHVRNRIRKYYRRDSVVIYPPVAVDKFIPGKLREDFYMTVSALVPYKRIDIAVKACTEMSKNLIVVGNGSEIRYLQSIAGKTIKFVGPQSPAQLAELYKKCIAMIHPGEEDFGIAPVEVQAAGRPVIAYKRGGVLETVIGEGENRTGAFFEEQTVDSLMKVLDGFENIRFDSAVIRSNAERFNTNRFRQEIGQLIETCWNQSQSIESKN